MEIELIWKGSLRTEEKGLCPLARAEGWQVRDWGFRRGNQEMENPCPGCSLIGTRGSFL